MELLLWAPAVSSSNGRREHTSGQGYHSENPLFSATRRTRDARAANEQRGFTVHGLYWTQGQYDLVAVVEAPDEQAMMAGLLNIAGAGNVRSQTLRAFTEPEMAAIIAKM